MDNYIGIYLGIKDYGSVKINSKENCLHLFFVNGVEKEYNVSSSNNFALQNILQEGYIYQFKAVDGKVIFAKLLDKGDNQIIIGKIDSISDSTLSINNHSITINSSIKIYKIIRQPGRSYVIKDSINIGDTVKIYTRDQNHYTIYKTPISTPYEPPIKATPGLKTLKNFIATALQPVGTTLYVFGGGWNWQDTSGGNQSMIIGLSQSWLDFFQMNDENYTYKNIDDPSKSYYFFCDIVEYYYAGLDCSAFVGWVIYNTVETSSNNVSDFNGYGTHSTLAAKRLSERGWGTWTRDEDQDQNSDKPDSTDRFMPGDIFSMDGHVWISLGTCEDGSIVIIHSTPSKSRAGQPGGGVQISALNPKESGSDCQAYRLASTYMSRYYPEWSKRYEAILSDYKRYGKVAQNQNAGKFRWDLSGKALLSDEEGFAKMRPDEILARIFGEL